MTHDEKIKAADRLSKMGGFYAALGKALLLADNVNEEKLIRAFPECITQQNAKLKVIFGGRYNHLS
jgi:hypothetical protein